MKKLGFGFMRLPLLDTRKRKSIDFVELNSMVDMFIERGFCYFDTAYPYHDGYSEIALKKSVVERYPRDKYLVADKLPLLVVNNEDHMAEIFSEQLKKCGIEYFDTYLLHAVGENNQQLLDTMHAFEFIIDKKKQGYAKKIGFSFHGSPTLLEELIVKFPELDIVQLQINYLDWEDPIIEAKKCYAIARKYNKEIIVMEPIKGGMLANISDKAYEIFKKVNIDYTPADWALRYVASLEGVECVLSGMSNLKQLSDNTHILEQDVFLSEDEHGAYDQVLNVIKNDIAIPCTSCHYCVSKCPQHILIPDFFTLYNNYKKNLKSQKLVSVMYYGNLIKTTPNPQLCVKCKKCNKSCPQHIDVSEVLAEVNYEMKKLSLISLKKYYKKTKQ